MSVFANVRLYGTMSLHINCGSCQGNMSHGGDFYMGLFRFWIALLQQTLHPGSGLKTTDCSTLVCRDLKKQPALIFVVPTEAVHFNYYIGQLSQIKKIKKSCPQGSIYVSTQIHTSHVTGKSKPL